MAENNSRLHMPLTPSRPEEQRPKWDRRGWVLMDDDTT